MRRRSGQNGDETQNLSSSARTRPGADVLCTRVLEYIFQVLVLLVAVVLLEIMGHVLVLVLNVLKYYEYIRVL